MVLGRRGRCSHGVGQQQRRNSAKGGGKRRREEEKEEEVVVEKFSIDILNYWREVVLDIKRGLGAAELEI